MKTKTKCSRCGGARFVRPPVPSPYICARCRATAPRPPAPAPARKAARPSLRDLERQRSREEEREWEDEINRGSEPPRWIRPGPSYRARYGNKPWLS